MDEEKSRLMMRHCLILLADRARLDGRSIETSMIEAALANDEEAFIRVRVGPAADRVSGRKWETLMCLNYFMRQNNNRSPTYDEMARLMLLSKVTISEHLHDFEKLGIITIEPYKMRSITFAHRQEETTAA